MTTIIGRWKPSDEVSDHERISGDWVWDRSWGKTPASHFQAKIQYGGNSIDFTPGFTPPREYQDSIRRACAQALRIRLPATYAISGPAKHALVKISEIIRDQVTTRLSDDF